VNGQPSIPLFFINEKLQVRINENAISYHPSHLDRQIKCSLETIGVQKGVGELGDGRK
jgi:hypothetical protein